MMKYLYVCALFLLSVLYSSCGQNKTPVAKNNTSSESVDSNNTQFRQHPDAAHHGVVHEFTHWVAMRDFCSKTLLQMRSNGQVNKKRSEELERELQNANAALTSSRYTGLKIESGLYEVFLKQMNDRFKD